MDDVGKAIIMAGQVLMFAFAATISIFLYNTLTSQVDGIMLANNYTNRGDSIVDNAELDTKRQATKAEVVMAILELETNCQKTDDYDYKVNVNGDVYGFSEAEQKITFKGTPLTDGNLNSSLGSIPNLNYELSYSEDGKVLIYD